ncbi:NUDIX domain-containing protein [Prolixibacter sp. SD074]|jgi:ADP-ribose pyrophosphatase YjhB (NUDIX family)|uniref:NUDIX hydrolase n=1 Tax=Prolixibacter sp. SD074 TaxID=2652391 RepID=UPI00126DD39C|nr:NUDIX domain-containing protein [Prolixibacter sp. SD074]GET27951.1 DNA mismatch repair protein MutT [Prolixibacter sp. SD074]
MMKFYSRHKRFLLALDVIIFGFDEEGLKLLLIKRGFEPCKGQWSLMGGFLQETEDMEQAADRILHKLTGLGDLYLEQLRLYSQPGRDSDGRIISMAYYALMKTERQDSEQLEKHNATWFKIDDIPELVFDHKAMVDHALARLRRKCRTQPIGFELLPDKFTIPQLQKLYETILGIELDKRNFRKKILSMELLQKLEEKDKSSSRKGAFLYQFDKEKYGRLIGEGFSFAV